MTSSQDRHVRTSSEREDDRGRVVRVTLDHARRINIVNTPILDELTATIAEVAADEGLRALVLTGAGDLAFIGGADIREMADLDAAGAEAFITRLHCFCDALRDVPVPVIARIDGYCLGAGLEVAAACDLRIASDRSTFGMPEVKVGIPSVIEAALLPTLIGWGKTRELLYTGESITSGEALSCRLVERVVPAEQLDAAMGQWIDSILAAGPRAIRLQKALLRRWESLPIAEAITAGIRTFRDAYATDEPRQYMRRFLDRKHKSE